MLNSHLGQLCATSLFTRHPFSRSYGVRLPSSLKRVLSITLGHLSPPTRVGLRYGRYYFNGNEVFLDGVESTKSYRISAQLSLIFNLISGVDLPAPASPGIRDTRCPIRMPDLPDRVLSLPPQQRYGNNNPLSIAYAFRPQLRPD